MCIVYIYIYYIKNESRSEKEKRRNSIKVREGGNEIDRQAENKHPGTIGLYARHVDRRRGVVIVLLEAPPLRP